MAEHSVEVRGFSATLRKTDTWLSEIQEELNLDGSQRAYQVLRTTLHAVRDRLPTEEATHLAAQLPMLVRGFFYEGWTPAARSDRVAADFLAPVEALVAQQGLGVDSRSVVRAVLRVLSRHVTSGEIEDVKAAMPPELQELWPRTAGAETVRRPYRPVDLDRSDFEKLPIPHLVDQLMAERTFRESGRTALSLVSGDGFASVLTVARAGMRCDPHEAPGPGILLSVRGRVTVTTARDSEERGAKIALEEGEALALAPHVRHDLEAASDCAYLLVMGGASER